jgi:pimeloyl-ACP methyl ester carboxylesterase
MLARTSDAVAVAGHLGMARFAVQGTSGGGPYALACAALMPDRVQAVILTSAGGRIGEAGGLDGLPEDIAEGWRRDWRDPEAAREERIYPGGNHFSPWVTRQRQAAMLALIPG